MCHSIRREFYHHIFLNFIFYFQDMVRTFLLQLACSQDQSLQCLSFRLDFNQHYKRKDARLGTPLTFQHKRDSMLTASFHV